MSKPRPFHQALLERRFILDTLRKLAGALPPAPSAIEAMSELEAHRELALSVSLNELSSPSTVLRHAVAAALRHLQAQEVSMELEELSEDPRVPDENRVIARELYRELRPGRLPSSHAFPIPTPGRPQAAKQLLDVLDEDPNARSAFLAAFSGAPTDTRITAVEGLAETRDERVVPLLEAASLDREARVAETALKALAESPLPKAREILEELASGARGQAVRKLAGRFLLGLEPEPPGAQGKAAHSVAGPLDIQGERDLILVAPRSGGARWDLLRLRLSVRFGILSVETRPNISASSAMNATTKLSNNGGYLSSGPGYARLLVEDALSAPEAGPNRLGPWRSLMGSRSLSPRPYRPSERMAPEEAKSNLRVADRLLRSPEFRGWFTSDPDLDQLRALIQGGSGLSEVDVMGRFFDEFLLPRRPVLLRALELTRDLLLRKGERTSAKAVTAAEWALLEGNRDQVAGDPFFLALVRKRLVAASFEPARSY